MRPLVFFSISFILGISFSYSVLNKSEIIISIAILLFLFILYLYKFNIRKFIIYGSIFFLIIGFIEFASTDKKLSVDSIDEIYLVEGKVKSIKKDYIEEKYEYIIYLKGREANSNKVNFKVKLYTLNDIKIGYNDIIRVNGKIINTYNVNNKATYSKKNYYYSLKISGIIYSDDIEIIKRNKSFSLIKLGYKVKFDILDFISNKLKDKESALLAGMIIGDDSYQSDKMKEEFRESGLSHIMVASGANLLYIIIPLTFIFKKLKIRTEYSNIIILIILFFYLVVTGFELSILRAFIMAFILLISRVIRRDYDVYTSLSLSALINLIYNPYVLFNIGFQLSYIATVSIILFYDKFNFKIKPNILKDTIAVTISVQAGVVPILILYFNKVPIISIVTNLLVVPITGLVTIIGFISYFISFFSDFLSILLIYINNICLSFIIWVSEFSSQLKFSTIDYNFKTSNIVIVLYIIIIIILFYFGKEKYIIVSLLILIVLFTNYSKLYIKEDKLEITFLDVGSGDAIYIEINNQRKILLDGGNKKTEGEFSIDYGKEKVAPFLNSKYVKNLDMVITSHNHSDHVGGLEYILKNFDISKFVYSESYKEYEILNEVKSKEIESYFVNSNDIINLNNNSYIKILNPDENIKDENENNNSIVFMLYYKDFKGIFCGDVEKEIEEKLVNSNCELDADLLKVPHHGSSTSSTLEFIKKINPKVAVISVGKNNFGHPSLDVIERYEKENIKIYRTDICGNIKVTTFGDNKLIVDNH
jgi:competence protein ComEC